MTITIPDTNSDRLILIDAHSLIFQVFHAIRDRMTSPSGVPTNALFGFARDMMFLRKQRPEYLVCAFDSSGPTFREALYPQYKANRDEMPSDLALQIPLIHEVLQAMNIPVVSHPDYEADDLIATLAHAGAERGLDVLICSSDKDCRQLISDRIRVFSLRKRQEFGRKELLDEWGITPEQAVDFQTLVGDSVDNVPGVPGIGEKTAGRLLQQFGTLENLLAHIDQVPGAKKQESLRASLPTLELSRRLVRLARDVPIELDWEAWRFQEWDAPRVQNLFQGWGFQSLLAQVRTATAPAGERQQLLFPEEELFPFGANAPNGDGKVRDANWQATYHLVDTPEKFAPVLEELHRCPRFAIDLETTGLQPLECEIVGIALSWREGEAWYLALRGPADANVLDPHATLAALKPILENPAVSKVNQNIKYDLLVLRAHGIEVLGVAGDPMVADYLLHAGERSHNLEDLARRYLNHQVIPITDLIGPRTRKQAQLRMDEVATARVAEYAGEDADVAWRLTRQLEQQLAQPDRSGKPSPLAPLYHEVEIPLIAVLAEMEFNGIRLDCPRLEQLSREMEAQLTEIEGRIYQLAGHRFQISSLPQLRKVLFDELKLPPQRKTGTTGAASTDQETLEKLAALTDHPGHELPGKILEHRQIAKLKSTYVDSLPQLLNPRTGRIHASFNQTVAATGRLSSSDPNLQNIPVRREQGQQIRQAFLPEAGWLLVTADYSQIELRLLAHFCEDDTLCRAFALDRDIHSAVAAEIFGVREADVSPAHRRMAKTVNFGVVYGISAHGLAQRLRIPREEAARFIDAYFARYPRVQEYQTRLLENCRQNGYVSTILGRRRRIDGIRPNSTYQQRNQPEREAINMEVQGSAADLIKLAMLRVHRRLRAEQMRARLLLQIHDELVFEAPPEEQNRLVHLVRHEMTTPLQEQLALKVPLQVDVARGPNWLDVIEVPHTP